MRRPWLRRRPGLDETRKAAATALGLGALVGVVAFYFARLLLSRERVMPPPGPDGDGGEPASAVD